MSEKITCTLPHFVKVTEKAGIKIRVNITSGWLEIFDEDTKEWEYHNMKESISKIVTTIHGDIFSETEQK